MTIFQINLHLYLKFISFLKILHFLSAYLTKFYILIILKIKNLCIYGCTCMYAFIQTFRILFHFSFSLLKMNTNRL